MAKYDISIGDVTPVIYGGFLVSNDGNAIYWNEPTEREYSSSDPDDDAKTIPAYRFTVEPDVMKDLDWVKPSNWDSIADAWGVSTEELKQMSKSHDVWVRAELYEQVGNHFGWANIDGYPMKHSYNELAAMYPAKVKPGVGEAVDRITTYRGKKVVVRKTSKGFSPEIDGQAVRTVGDNESDAFDYAKKRIDAELESKAMKEDKSIVAGLLDGKLTVSEQVGGSAIWMQKEGDESGMLPVSVEEESGNWIITFPDGGTLYVDTDTDQARIAVDAGIIKAPDQWDGTIRNLAPEEREKLWDLDPSTITAIPDIYLDQADGHLDMTEDAGSSDGKPILIRFGAQWKNRPVAGGGGYITPTVRDVIKAIEPLDVGGMHGVRRSNFYAGYELNLTGIDMDLARKALAVIREISPDATLLVQTNEGRSSLDDVSGAFATEPDEDDIVTSDDKRWYMSGKLYHTGNRVSLARKMDKDQYWPDVWMISDHGNPLLITSDVMKSGRATEGDVAELGQANRVPSGGLGLARESVREAAGPSVSGELPPGEYYFGDICYIMDEEIYYKVWGGEHNFKDGKYVVNHAGKSGVFAVGGTAYGDGAYEGKQAIYGVDAGVLGLVPRSLWGADRISKSRGLGVVFKSSSPVKFDFNGGEFSVDAAGFQEYVNTASDKSNDDVDDEPSEDEEQS